MPFIADLHLHSHHSYATSPSCDLVGLAHWAQLKGIRVVGTGDCTHPAWLNELREALTPSAPGLFALRPDRRQAVNEDLPPACQAPVDFMLTGEISCIYRRHGRPRRVHAIVFLPDFATAEVLSARLAETGNVAADGRPILKLDVRDLFEIVLDTNPDAILVPAHIWTPWYAMLGSKSGFDSPVACFGDLADQLTAVETGLSSDPPMNWRVAGLDGRTLIANSDLHSPANLGRNANVFELPEPDFFAMRQAWRTGAGWGGTIDLFPEAGKYHFDGHRACGVRLLPAESQALAGRCPRCGKPLTLGVLHRVGQLATRPEGFRPAEAPPHRYVVPLPEIVGELLGVGARSKRVAHACNRLQSGFGPEFGILYDLPVTDLPDNEPPRLAEAVANLRAGRVWREAGYDGVYGTIRLLLDRGLTGASS